jgi:hypothetical protein
MYVADRIVTRQIGAACEHLQHVRSEFTVQNAVRTLVSTAARRGFLSWDLEVYREYVRSDLWHGIDSYPEGARSTFIRNVIKFLLAYVAPYLRIELPSPFHSRIKSQEKGRFREPYMLRPERKMSLEAFGLFTVFFWCTGYDDFEFRENMQRGHCCLPGFCYVILLYELRKKKYITLGCQTLTRDLKESWLLSVEMLC